MNFSVRPNSIDPTRERIGGELTHRGEQPLGLDPRHTPPLLIYCR
jgi:hypothetical protein